MPYDLIGAEDILAGLDVLGDGLSESGDDWMGTMLSGADADLQDLLAGAAPAAAAAPAVKQYLAKQAAARQIALKHATKDLAMRHAQAVVPRGYNRGRKLVQGIGSQDVTDTVAPGASRTFITQPQVPFKPDRFFVSTGASIASNFLISDIKVGQQSMFASSQPVPATMFAENAVDSPINFDTAQISQQLIVIVVNIGGANSPFFGAFRGFAAL